MWETQAGYQSWTVSYKNMNNVVYISDAFLDDIIGGGELNDYELLQMLRDRGHSVVRRRTHRVTLDFINKNWPKSCPQRETTRSKIRHL